MELLLLLGLAALVVLLALGGLAFLQRRRAGTVLAVTLPARTLTNTVAQTRQTDRTARGHR
jgi:hypothetical protein